MLKLVVKMFKKFFEAISSTFYIIILMVQQLLSNLYLAEFLDTSAKLFFLCMNTVT